MGVFFPKVSCFFF